MFSKPTGTNQVAASGLVFIAALAVILGAWGFQIFGGYLPCKLCLEQRIPYYAGVPLAFLVLLVAHYRGPAAAIRLGLVVFAILMLVGMGLAIYQSGAEWKWWLGPKNCGGAKQQTRDITKIGTSISNSKFVDCGFASWRFLGLSFAGWNAVSSLGLALVALWGAFAGAGRKRSETVSA